MLRSGTTLLVARLGCVAVLAVVVSCGGSDSPPDGGGGDAGDGPADAAAFDASTECIGSPSGGCEVVVNTADECPALEDVCDGVCGAGFECCYCDAPDWTVIFIDCPPCTDAGSD